MGEVGRHSGRSLHIGAIDLSICGFDAQDVFLDAGTGRGYLMETLPSRCKAVHATDIAADSLRRIRGSATQDNPALAQADLRRMPFRSLCFTWVICIEVLAHLSDVSDSSAESQRAVGPCGTVVVAVPTHSPERHSGTKANTFPKRNEGISSPRRIGFKVVSIRDESLIPALYWRFRQVFPI